VNFIKASQHVASRVARDTIGQLANPFTLPEWLHELKNREVLRADIIAGLTVALILIPQSMAYAQLAGLPAHYGLYASLLPPMIATFFGSSRQLATGPVAMVSLMTAAALAPLATAGGEAFIGYALLLSLMVGLFQLAMGMFRLGVLLNFLSHPVVLGFVNAAAIIIATSQLAKIFGVTPEPAEHHYQFVINTLRAAMDHTHWPTLAMAILAFGIMYWLRRNHPRLPFVLIAVVVTTVLAWLFGFEKHRSVELSQINNQELRVSLIFDGLQGTHIARQEEKYFSAQQTYNEMAKGVSEESAELLSQRQLLEQTKFILDQLKEEAVSYHKKLYATALYQVGEGEDMKLFTREEILKIAGEENKVYGQDWHIVSYGNDVVELQAGGQVLGNIPRGLPGFRLPKFDWSAISHLIGAAIAISLIGFMEAVSIARTLAAKTRQNLDADRELMGQGLSNIVGSMFQSAPVAGSFSRSAVNHNAGAVTGFSAVVTTIAVALTLLLLTPLLYYLPQATLAAVIILAVAGLVSVKPVIHAWKVNRHDGVVAIVTFVLTLAMAEMGILFGMLLSLILLLFRVMQPRIVFPPHSEDLMPDDALAEGAMEDQRIVRLRFDGSLMFANVPFFEEHVQALLASTPQLKVLIIDGVSITDVDASGEMALRETFSRLHDAGITVLFTRFKRPIMETLKRTHLRDDIGKSFFHRNPARAYERAWEVLLAEASADSA
jgi:MFS superfamily sulfate permease-like transporter